MTTGIKPFVKWVGGKRQLICQMSKFIPNEFNTYYEPFLGAGAVFFNLLPNKAHINDMNEELINVYKIIRNDVNNLIIQLKVHEKNNSKEYYYNIRKWDRDVFYTQRSNLEKAARFIYMNKVSYNGLYRVNKSGQFNVPYGRYTNPKIVDETLLKNISSYLNKNEIAITSIDFEKATNLVSAGDFVYFDPPYDPINNTSSFTEYQKGGFDRDEQIRLKKVADNLVKRGAKVILSNSNTKFINDLYLNKIDGAKDSVAYFIIETMNARRNINSKGDRRGKIKEVLIISKDGQR